MAALLILKNTPHRFFDNITVCFFDAFRYLFISNLKLFANNTENFVKNY